jgi:hypothetical protein
VEALAASGRAVELATTEVERGFALVAAAQSARGARKWTEAIESAERAMGLLAPDPRAAVHAEIERSLALAESGRGKEALDALDAAERRTGVTTENPETAAALRLLRSRWTDDWSSVDEIVSMDIHGLFAAQARWFAAHSRAAKGVLDRPALEQALALLHGQGLCQLEVRCAWLLARCDWLDRESDAALKHCLAAIDAALGTPLAFPPLASDLAWLAPRLALDGDDASAARVLRALVAWSSDETAPNADAERALLDAATQIVTLCAPELADSLLSDATGDLPRPRRALLEPFVLAARCGLSPREAVLLEQPDEMRRVVDDVLARADVIGRGPLPDPPWLHGSLLA